MTPNCEIWIYQLEMRSKSSEQGLELGPLELGAGLQAMGLVPQPFFQEAC